jgi:hypothetical protein
MTTGTVTLAFLLLTTNALPPDIAPMNALDFPIPIQIVPTRRAQMRELLLFVSEDEGKHWDLRHKVSPDAQTINFSAPHDGLYWFHIAVVDQQGKQDPPSPSAPGAAALKVLIDTRKPDLRIPVVERQGEGVVVKWDVKDDNLDLNSLKLEQRTAETPWTAVAIPFVASGQASFRPPNLGPVQVRMLVKDLVGNESTTPAPELPAQPGYVPPLPPNTGAGAPTLTGNAGGPPNPVTPTSRDPKWDSPIQPVNQVDPPRMTEKRMEEPPLPPPPPGVGATAVQAPGSFGQVVAKAGGQPTPPEPAPAAPAPPRTTPSQLVPLQFIKNRELTLDYEVAKIGPSGLGSVELFVTQDEGRSWQKVADFQNLTQTEMEQQSSSGTVQRSLKVTLPQTEGRFGFFLVVKSKAGHGKPNPESGTLPQVRVELDYTPPEAELYLPEPEPGHRDHLILHWKASDRNLTPTPITLEWAERRDGDWKKIGEAELPNTGRTVWQLPPTGMPPHVYLRLTVRDAAGNVSVAETDKPVTIDMNEPEVTNIHVNLQAHP